MKLEISAEFPLKIEYPQYNIDLAYFTNKQHSLPQSLHTYCSQEKLTTQFTTLFTQKLQSM